MTTLPSSSEIPTGKVAWMQEASPSQQQQEREPSSPQESSSHAQIKTMPASSWVIHTAFIFLGVASFLMSNALWAELSSLYRALPESNRLGSYLLISLQAGNIVPAVLMIEGSHLRLLRLESCIWLILTFGFINAQLISYLWDKTDEAGGHLHSIALFILTFFVGCVNNSSGLAFYPYVARFERKYVSTLATGEGLSGIIVAALAAIQDAGGSKQRFSITIYFQCVSFIYVLSFASYFFLLSCEAQITTVGSRGGGGDTDGNNVYKRIDEVPALLDATALLDDPSLSGGEEEEGMMMARRADHPTPAAAEEESIMRRSSNSSSTFAMIWQILVVQAIISALAYGCIPSILPIAITGYKDESHILQYSSFVSMTMDPIARAITHVVRCYKLKLLLVFVIGFASIIIACAVLSPHPFLYPYRWGGLLIIFVNGAFTSSFAFSSTMVYFSVRRVLTLTRGESSGTIVTTTEQLDLWQKGFKWSAFAIQAGAFVGSVISFVLANH